jgi:hypothetical protein
VTIRLHHVLVQIAQPLQLTASQLAEFQANLPKQIEALIVQPVLLQDDGELTPGPATQPVQLTADQFAEFVEKLPDEIAKLNDAEESDG